MLGDRVRASRLLKSELRSPMAKYVLDCYGSPDPSSASEDSDTDISGAGQRGELTQSRHHSSKSAQTEAVLRVRPSQQEQSEQVGQPKGQRADENGVGTAQSLCDSGFPLPPLPPSDSPPTPSLPRATSSAVSGHPFLFFWRTFSLHCLLARNMFSCGGFPMCIPGIRWQWLTLVCVLPSVGGRGAER
jgi:hypothetical protein